MPPRHTYWTIILEGKPTAFRAADAGRTAADAEAAAGAASRRGDDVVRARPAVELAKKSRARRYVQKRPPGDRRGPDVAAGGAHEDPRARFKIPRDEKRRRFRERLFGDDAADDREVPVDEAPRGRTTATPDVPPRPEPIADRPASKDRRPPREADRPERPRSDRKPHWKPRPQASRATGPRRPGGGDRRMETQPTCRSRHRRRRSRMEAQSTRGQGTGGGDRGWKPSRPAGPGHRRRRSRLETQSARRQGTGGGDRGWKPSRPAGQGTRRR